MSKKENAVEVVPVWHIVRIGSCESLSGLSQLEYHIGYEEGHPEKIAFRIWNNSGGGMFNRTWFRLDDILKVMTKAGKTFKAAALSPIATGQSINTPSFIGAALKAEGLLVRSEAVPRSYEHGNADMWREQITALIAAGTRLETPPILTRQIDRALVL